MNRLVMFAVGGVLLSAAASARQGLTQVAPHEITRITPDAVAQVNAAGKRITPFVTLGENPLNTPLWATMFDSMNTNPATQVTYSDFYGNDNGPSRFALNYRNSIWVNDAVMPVGRRGRPAKLIRIGYVWNPSGNTTLSGTQTCAIRVRFAEAVGADDSGPSDTNPLGGLLIVRNALAAGIYESDLNLSTGPLALMTPWNSPSALKIEIGTLNGGGAFIPLSHPAAAQPLLSPMIAPGDPQFPGTNPSSSGAFMWADDETPTVALFGQNRPNHILDTLSSTAGGPISHTERYSYDYTGDTAGNLQAAVGVFQDLNAKRIEGTVLFSNTLVPPTTGTIEIRNAAGDTVIQSFQVSFSGTGAYSLTAPAPYVAGTYTIYCRQGSWLGRLSSAFTTTNVSTNASLVLTNGDVNGNNEIGPEDFSLLAGAFGTFAGDPGYTDAADLNDDGEVGPSDFAVLAASFGEFGD